MAFMQVLKWGCCGSARGWFGVYKVLEEEEIAFHHLRHCPLKRIWILKARNAESTSQRP
jgi:hypothetical protein